jgi:hypothetical protein
MKKDYLSLRDAEMIIWLTNFETTIRKEGEKLGLSAAEIEALIADCKNMVSSIQKADEANRVKKAATEAKNKTVSNGKKDIRKSVNKIKADDNYSQAIGDALGIIGETETFDADNYKQEIKLSIVSKGVQVDFKKSHTDGINVYRRTEGEARWTYLARDTRSPYIDTEKLDGHSTLEYKAWAVIDDEEIGVESDIAQITV